MTVPPTHNPLVLVSSHMLAYPSAPGCVADEPTDPS